MLARPSSTYGRLCKFVRASNRATPKFPIQVCLVDEFPNRMGLRPWLFQRKDDSISNGERYKPHDDARLINERAPA